MAGDPAGPLSHRRDLTRLTSVELARERMDAFERLELAQFAWDQFEQSPVQSPERGHFLAEVLGDAHDSWLAVHAERTRREQSRT